jgi:hypothetical protein
MLRRKRKDAVDSLTKFHNMEFHNLHSSPNIIRTIKTRRMIWAGHAASTGNARKILGG